MGRCLLAAVALCAACAWPAEIHNNFVYQIFVRSFADTPTDQHAGGEIGDLRGIRENFDYLNDGKPGKGSDLEAGILWVMPIFPSQTYHGYDIDDYRAVNPEYGTMQDLKALIELAHSRRVRIILDIALNHTSNRHPWFLDAVRDPRSMFREFYHVRPDEPGTPPKGWHRTGGVQYLGLFGANMPDLNLSHAATRAQVKAIAKFWLDQGIDGFRLDAAKHIFDDADGTLDAEETSNNNRWWREFCSYVYSVKPSAVLVGEVLGKPEALRSHASGLDALLDEPFLEAARDHLVYPRSGFLHTWLTSLRSYQVAHASAGGNRPFDTWAFLGSHDRTPRLASFLDQQAPPGRAGELYRLGMYVLFASARFPVLYNGDELMQRGVKWPSDGSRIYDKTLREPFPWYQARMAAPQTAWFAPRYDKPNDGVSVEEQGKRGSMLAVVRDLAQLRTRHPGFADSGIETLLSDSEEWLVFARGSYLVLIRTAAQAASYRFHQDWYPEWLAAHVVYRSDPSGGLWKDGRLSVPGFGFVLLQRR